jgi:hypothetical protein
MHQVATWLALCWLSGQPCTVWWNIRIRWRNHICVLQPVSSEVLLETERLFVAVNAWVWYYKRIILSLCLPMARLALWWHTWQKLLQIRLRLRDWFLNLAFWRTSKVFVHFELLDFRSFSLFWRHFNEVEQNLIRKECVPLFILTVAATVFYLHWVTKLCNSVVWYEGIALIFT